jgi:hypothetical protein
MSCFPQNITIKFFSQCNADFLPDKEKEIFFKGDEFFSEETDWPQSSSSLARCFSPALQYSIKCYIIFRLFRARLKRMSALINGSLVLTWSLSRTPCCADLVRLLSKICLEINPKILVKYPQYLLNTDKKLQKKWLLIRAWRRDESSVTVSDVYLPLVTLPFELWDLASRCSAEDSVLRRHNQPSTQTR